MKNDRHELRMYFLVMYNISTMQKGVQCSHISLEYANKYKNDNDLEIFTKEDKTIIVLDGGTSSDIKQLVLELEENEVKFANFVEPDLNDAIVGVCFLADERVWNTKDYPSYETWKMLNNIETKYELTNPPKEIIDPIQYNRWVEMIGGEKNLFLRKLIQYKPLAR